MDEQMNGKSGRVLRSKLNADLEDANDSGAESQQISQHDINEASIFDGQEDTYPEAMADPDSGKDYSESKTKSKNLEDDGQKKPKMMRTLSFSLEGSTIRRFDSDSEITTRTTGRPLQIQNLMNAPLHQVGLRTPRKPTSTVTSSFETEAVDENRNTGPLLRSTKARGGQQPTIGTRSGSWKSSVPQNSNVYWRDIAKQSPYRQPSASHSFTEFDQQQEAIERAARQATDLYKYSQRSPQNQLMPELHRNPHHPTYAQPDPLQYAQHEYQQGRQNEYHHNQQHQHQPPPFQHQQHQPPPFQHQQHQQSPYQQQQQYQQTPPIMGNGTETYDEYAQGSFEEPRNRITTTVSRKPAQAQIPHQYEARANKSALANQRPPSNTPPSSQEMDMEDDRIKLIVEAKLQEILRKGGDVNLGVAGKHRRLCSYRDPRDRVHKEYFVSTANYQKIVATANLRSQFRLIMLTEIPLDQLKTMAFAKTTADEFRFPEYVESICLGFLVEKYPLLKENGLEGLITTLIVPGVHSVIAGIVKYERNRSKTERTPSEEEVENDDI